MNNECLNIMTFANRSVFLELSYPIFAYIKKLRFPIGVFCHALKENPVQGSLFMYVILLKKQGG